MILHTKFLYTCMSGTHCLPSVSVRMAVQPLVIRMAGGWKRAPSLYNCTLVVQAHCTCTHINTRIIIVQPKILVHCYLPSPSHFLCCRENIINYITNIICTLYAANVYLFLWVFTPATSNHWYNNTAWLHVHVFLYTRAKSVSVLRHIQYTNTYIISVMPVLPDHLVVGWAGLLALSTWTIHTCTCTCACMCTCMSKSTEHRNVQKYRPTCSMDKIHGVVPSTCIVHVHVCSTYSTNSWALSLGLSEYTTWPLTPISSTITHQYCVWGLLRTWLLATCPHLGRHTVATITVRSTTGRC